MQNSLSPYSIRSYPRSYSNNGYIHQDRSSSNLPIQSHPHRTIQLIIKANLSSPIQKPPYLASCLITSHFTAFSNTALPRLPFSYPIPQNPHLTLIFTQFNAPVPVDTSRFLLGLAILQARVRALDQQPIRGDITNKADDEDPRNAIVLTLRPQAQLTWSSWYYAANGLLSFLERYEYVEFGYRLKNDEGAVLAVGELADLRSSAKARDG